ncbi:MAG: amino acid ABC transporter permease [Clostridia bacterium]|nr:amino acid ABC transporter permease [Clostridia bacterium]
MVTGVALAKTVAGVWNTIANSDFFEVTARLFEGLFTTVELFVLTLLFALPLGLIICFGSKCKFAPLRYVVKTIVWIVRGSPLMLQIFVVYYGPGLLFGWDLLPRFTAALVTFVINYACYFSEIYRGGIQSIPRGQYEAGQVLGMTKWQVFTKVTLLQLIKRIVPPMGNEFITLVKDTALVRVISVYEIIWMGESFIKKGMMWPLFYTAVFYLVFNGLLTLALGYFEMKLDYFKS